MGEISEFVVGQAVELSDGKKAVVRFVGQTQFASGDWLGVELEDASGKNDGSVQGQRYFNCPPGHGMFCRPAVVSTVEPTVPKSTKRNSIVAPSGATRSRPLSIGPTGLSSRRQSILDNTSKRQTINATSPTPPTKSQGTARSLRSPTRSPTKQLSSRTSSVSSKVTTSAGTRGSITSSRRPNPVVRSSITSSSTLTSSKAPPATGSASSIRTSLGPRKVLGGSTSTLQQSSKQPKSVSLQNERRSAPSQKVPSGSEALPPGDDLSEDKQTSNNKLQQSQLSSQVVSGDLNQNQATTVPTRANASNAVLSREIEDLKTKLKVAEKKRLEDREKLKNVEKLQSERDKFESIIQKLQTKMQPQQQEIVDLKKQLREIETKALADESQRLDFDTAIEMATVDREMAEESAEACKTELETVRARCEELELEVEILREENSELGKEMSPEERTSQGWVQLERNNERLREALLRLRDMTQEQETELKYQIQELQNETSDLADIREKYEDVRSKFEQSEQVTEDLRQQLDGALGAEEMIEELTEKNMTLTEKIDELKVAIGDLESLKELNDELEANHVENEKQLQEEVDQLEALYFEQLRKFSAQEDTITDLEYTISRFRELVGTLQIDLDELRTSQQIRQTEDEQRDSRSRAMMDLNLKLQASATRAQNKAIEMELGKLEAQQASDHLSIAQHFLPDSYAIDRDSINAYLRIKRIQFKTNLLHSFVKERAYAPASSGHEEDTFAACTVMDGLTWVSSMCRKFVRFISCCPLDSFKKLEGALHDLDPVERALNSWVESLKRDELREAKCASELQRSIAVISHLSEIHIPETIQTFADDVRCRAVMMQSRLESAAVAISQMKQISQAKIMLPTDADEEDEAAAERFLNKADALISHLRSTNSVAGKSIHQLEELESRSLTLDPATQPTLDQVENEVIDLVTACQESAVSLIELINEEGRIAPFTYDEISRAISPKETLVFGQLLSRSQAVATYVQNFYALSTTLSQTVEFGALSDRAPWEVLSQNIKAEASASALHEKEVKRLKDELTERNTAIAMKDKNIEELNVNIEVLSKRVTETGGRKEKLKELEISIEASRSKEQDTASQLASLRRDYQTLEAEREAWAKQNTQSNIPTAEADIAANSSKTHLVSPTSKAEQEIVQLKMKRINNSFRQVRQSLRRAPASAVKAQLAEPLVPSKYPRDLDVWSHFRNPREAANESENTYLLLAETLANQEFKTVRIASLKREHRLSWRPLNSAPRFESEQQKLHFGIWSKVKNDGRRLGRQLLNHRDSTASDSRAKAEQNNEIAARIGVRLFKSAASQSVTIVKPEEWTRVEEYLRVN